VGQCPKPGTGPIWDSNKEQFRCTDPAGMTESASGEIVTPTGDKGYCKSIREDLQKACPSSDEGKGCKNAAKSIYERCYKGSTTSSGATGRSPRPSQKDAAACMATYTQQQQACQSRATPPRAPGQPYVPDTCLSDALAAQNKCLANAR
jgi:hypothetical protein